MVKISEDNWADLGAKQKTVIIEIKENSVQWTENKCFAMVWDYNKDEKT
jgi:hypothetical protein